MGGIQHPEIDWYERTGYPSDMQPKPICCEECGEEIEGDEYFDSEHELLCERCLLSLHKVWRL